MGIETIDTKDQAVLVRRALARHFPGTKFSVRIQRFAGGSTVHVEWANGPSRGDVSAVAQGYDGTRFDALIDLAYRAHHYLLPDGSVEFSHTDGHSGSSEERREGPPPTGGRLVHFAGSVSCHRSPPR